MKRLAIFDMDGTLSDHYHRLHLVIQRPADFEAYHTLAPKDRPIAWVADEARKFKETGAQVVIVTNRPQRFYDQTAQWLKKHGIPFDAIFMRKREKDHRRTEVVKAELVEDVKKDYVGYEIVAVFEDRPKVLEKFRAMGLPVILVGDGKDAG
jgi:phosphoglycolate phosphatase-like HAD superfamily hydrolase